MGFLQTLSPVAQASRVVAMSTGGPATNDGLWHGPDGWVSNLVSAGVNMTPELALTLSYVYSAVDMTSGDFGTCPCQTYRDLGNDGRTKVKFSDAGIGSLAYRLRWQPNNWQSAKAFWSTLVWQYQLRPAAYAEIIYRPGSDSLVEQLIPRHPDRVEQLRLSNGNISFKLREPGGKDRFITAAEMFVVRNTSTDGLNAIGRIDYAAKSLASGLSLQDFTRAYFKKGATPALLATYKGQDMDEDEEAALYNSITRYVSGAENAGGVMLVPEDIDVKYLGVDPEKAQLLGLKETSGRDVARMYKIPPYKLAIPGTQAYASQVQSAQDYVTTAQMPIVREFQDAIYIHLIVGRDFYSKFNTAHLLQADYKTRMEGHEIAIRARVKRPSEARVEEDMGPDEELDRLSALDHRAGSSSRDGADNKNTAARAGGSSVRLTLAMHDNAVRVLRRERAAVEKLAKRFPSSSDVDQWKNGLKAFFEEHAGFVAETMRIPYDIARAYAAQHGQVLEANGVVAITEHWERLEAEALVELSLEPESIDRILAA